MVVFPLIATVVSTVFAVQLFRQYRAKKRLPQLAWGVALAQFAIASLMVTIAVLDRWAAPSYRVFWLFGALLNVAWLAVGSIALVAKRVVAQIALGLVIAGSLFAAVSVLSADLNRSALGTTTIPAGREVWGEGALQMKLLTYYSIIPYLIVVGIALWSCVPRRGMRAPADRIKGNLMIALGVTVVAVGGFALRRIGRGSAFSVSLALGVVIMFVGFVLASRAPRYRVEDPGDSPT